MWWCEVARPMRRRIRNAAALGSVCFRISCSASLGPNFLLKRGVWARRYSQIQSSFKCCKFILSSCVLVIYCYVTDTSKLNYLTWLTVLAYSYAGHFFSSELGSTDPMWACLCVCSQFTGSLWPESQGRMYSYIWWLAGYWLGNWGAWGVSRNDMFLLLQATLNLFTCGWAGFPQQQVFIYSWMMEDKYKTLVRQRMCAQMQEKWDGLSSQELWKVRVLSSIQSCREK